MASLSAREQRLFSNLRRMVHYARCLEQECARLGNDTFTSERNTTTRDAEAIIAEIKGRDQ